MRKDKNGDVRTVIQKLLQHYPNSKMKGWSELSFWKSERWKTIQEELQKTPFNPGKEKIFRALTLTPLSKVRVVIIDQDPYPDTADSCGLAFSVPKDRRGKLPKSLHNIYKELRNDIHCEWPKNGDLSRWALQGVLLLNRNLTVLPGQPLSHSHLGWEDLTNEIVDTVCSVHPGAVFVLWGKEAQGLDTKSNPRVQSAHPSPLSAQKGFFGSRPFTKVNALLAHSYQPLIDWR